MINLIKRPLLSAFTLVFACLSVFGQFSPTQQRLRVNDFSLFFDDERTVLRGTSEYHYISDPLIYSELFPNNFGVLVNGTGDTKSNFLRIWMEGFSNTSGAEDNTHPVFGASSYDLYGQREQQPFKCTNYMLVDPEYYTYDLYSWPDYAFEGIDQYPDRMQDILREARDNNVIVMLTLFDACLKDYDSGKYWKYSAWNPQRNNYATSAYLPASGSPYPIQIDEETDKCFYNIWLWSGNTINFNQVNPLGALQEHYVRRVIKNIPIDCWNVIIEIENEPKPVIAHAGQIDYNLSARWSYQVACWIKDERPDILVAFNAHGDPSIRRALFELDQGSDRMIDMVSIHASYISDIPGHEDSWQLDDPDGPPYNGNYTAWENAEKDYILDALDRIREDENAPIRSRFYIIDSDGDYGDIYNPGGVYDQDPYRVRQIAGIASLFGAGYNNKYSSITNYNAPEFDQDDLAEFNYCINDRFFDEEQDWKYGMYNTYPDDYRRSYFENNAIRCKEKPPIIKTKGGPYSLDFKVINNGTHEDLEYYPGPDNAIYYLYDKTRNIRVPIEKTLEKVSPAYGWTIPISNLPSKHKTVVTMEFPTFPYIDGDFIVHELYLERKISNFIYEKIGGDVLYVVVNLVEE